MPSKEPDIIKKIRNRKLSPHVAFLDCKKTLVAQYSAHREPKCNNVNKNNI